GINATDHNAEGSSAKPIADVYLDDRAVRFVGDFDFALRQIWSAERVGPWWEDGGPEDAQRPPGGPAPPTTTADDDGRQVGCLPGPAGRVR
ncbi:MAG TPA: hypothetical protein VM487_12840, partial [Phycisphaerae bacterium]|nr:hypothetical protein [Phycisphaerae bacterium]